MPIKGRLGYRPYEKIMPLLKSAPDRATLGKIAALKFAGVRSSAGARAAVLAKFPGKITESPARSDVPDGDGRP
jgi:hypothetical protein